MKKKPNILMINSNGKKDVLAEVIEKHILKGPKEVEGPKDVPGLNMANPIASYAPLDPNAKLE